MSKQIYRHVWKVKEEDVDWFGLLYKCIVHIYTYMCVYSNHEHKTKFIVGYLIFFPIFLFSGFQKNKTKIGIHYDFVHANQNKTKTTQRNTEPQNTSLASHSNCLNAINRYVDARKVSICSLLLICRTKKHFGISLTIF